MKTVLTSSVHFFFPTVDNMDSLNRWKTVDHYISRVRGNLQMLEQLDLIGKTSEMARLFGIQFLHVLTRGSQVRKQFPCTLEGSL